jgi:hypothetical protein
VIVATTRHYAPPGDLVRLTSDEPRAFELAQRLWQPTAAHPSGESISIEVARRSPRPGDPEENAPEDVLEGDAAAFTLEERLLWVHEAVEFRCEVPGALTVRIDLAAAGVRAALSPAVSRALSNASSISSPALLSFFARTLLEAPAAVLLGRRGWQVLHAGAVVGPRGAAVVRGPSGAGKSTLVAAARYADLGVLGDESLFVSRDDPDALAASVRDLAIREDSARLLDVVAVTKPAFTGRERKCRVELFNGSAPPDRYARRAAAVLLGPRDPGPARLVPLSGDSFLESFRAGEIPQERSPGDPDAVARAWASGGGWLLSGTVDLDGAVQLLKGLVT